MSWSSSVCKTWCPVLSFQVSLIKHVFYEKRIRKQIKGWHNAQLATLAMITLKWELVPQSWSAQFSIFKVFIFINAVIFQSVSFHLEPYSLFHECKLILLPLLLDFISSLLLFSLYLSFKQIKTTCTFHYKSLRSFKVLETYFDCPYNFLVSEQIPVSWKKKKVLVLLGKACSIILWTLNGVISVADQVWSALQQGKMRWMFQNLVKKMHWAYGNYNFKKLITHADDKRITFSTN